MRIAMIAALLKFYIASFALALVVALSPALAAAASAPASSLSQCLNGGFKNLTNDKGKGFTSAEQCAEFVTAGGIFRRPVGDYPQSFYVRNSAGRGTLTFRVSAISTYCAHGQTSGEFQVAQNQNLQLEVTIDQSGTCHSSQSEAQWVIEIEQQPVLPVAFSIREQIQPGWSVNCWPSIPVSCNVSSDGIQSSLVY
jgi:hypothetical protein